MATTFAEHKKARHLSKCRAQNSTCTMRNVSIHAFERRDRTVAEEKVLSLQNFYNESSHIVQNVLYYYPILTQRRRPMTKKIKIGRSAVTGRFMPVKKAVGMHETAIVESITCRTTKK